MKGDMNLLTLSGCYRGAELHIGISRVRERWWALLRSNIHFIAPPLIRRHPVRADLLLNGAFDRGLKVAKSCLRSGRAKGTTADNSSTRRIRE